MSRRIASHRIASHRSGNAPRETRNSVKRGPEVTSWKFSQNKRYLLGVGLGTIHLRRVYYRMHIRVNPKKNRVVMLRSIAHCTMHNAQFPNI
jgi:hypothetical protein